MATKKTTTKKTTKAKVPTKSSVTAAKKPAVKKTVAKKAAPKKAAKKTYTPEERYKMIEQAAYYMAEKHHFQADPAAIWVEAEKQVDAQIAAEK